MSNLKSNRGLLVVDVQYDFMEGGALEIAGASAILPFVNARIVSGDYAVVVATQDLHPADHVSFGIWPPHCVEFTRGAELHAGLARERIDVILRKGRERGVDSYGAFNDDAGRPSGLAALLQARSVRELDVVGLATDYCVGTSALQAAPDFRTRVLLEGCRGVGLKAEDIPAMLQRLTAAGVEVVQKL